MLREYQTHNRKDGSALIVEAYSVEEIKAFNDKHDRDMGFILEFPTVYFNVRRLPESSFLPPEKLWNNG